MEAIRKALQRARNDRECLAAFKDWLSQPVVLSLRTKPFIWAAPIGETLNWQSVQLAMGRVLAESPYCSATYVKFTWSIDTVGVKDNAPTLMQVTVTIS